MDTTLAAVIYIIGGVIVWPTLWRRLGGEWKDPVFAAGVGMQLLNAYLVTMEQPPDFDLVIAQVKTVQAHAQTLIAAAFAVAIFALSAKQKISKWLPASILCSLAVLLLFWLPYGDVVKYDVLRHLKTVVFTFGMFFLMESIIDTVMPKLESVKPKEKKA